MSTRETYSAFRAMCLERFPVLSPDIEVCRKSDRKESGWEIVESIRDIKWPDLAVEQAITIGGGFNWVSDEWSKYLLPVYMCLSLESYTSRKYLDEAFEFTSDAEGYLIMRLEGLLDGKPHTFLWNTFTKPQADLVVFWLMLVGSLTASTIDFGDGTNLKSERLVKLRDILSSES